MKAYCKYCKYFRSEHKLKTDRSEVDIIRHLMDNKYLLSGVGGKPIQKVYPIKKWVKHNICKWYIITKVFDTYLTPKVINVYDSAIDRNENNICTHYSPNVFIIFYYIKLIVNKIIK